MPDRLAIMQDIQKCGRDTIIHGTRRPTPQALNAAAIEQLRGLHNSNQLCGTGSGLYGIQQANPYGGASLGLLPIASIGPSGLGGIFQSNIHE